MMRYGLVLEKARAWAYKNAYLRWTGDRDVDDSVLLRRCMLRWCAVDLDAPILLDGCWRVGMPKTLHSESIGDLVCPLAHRDNDMIALCDVFAEELAMMIFR